MKPGVRALGVAESFRDDESTLAGVVVRANRVVDGLSFGTCTVGGSDVTAAVEGLYDRLGREDVRYVMVSGIALAWYNLLDMHRLADAIDRPVLSVTYEASDGLDDAIREAFEGEAREARLATYRAQPDRTPVEVNGETVYVRAVGVDPAEARDVVRAFTPEGGRPEPLRVARMAARAGDALRRD
ncbi:DUF99 family protein [Haloarchaeobius sp. DYHT-AS-18]|uniref:endonuclease dU n=1 Tax=Haloarchaeobius sp. DYHT-AS-18 TaxID=3446117 RepID=UPI003EB95039